MPDEDQEYTIRQIEPGDKLAGLSLGCATFIPLKTYLARQAQAHHARSLAKTYGVFSHAAPKRAVGYMTLVCGEIAVTDVGEADGLDDYQYDHCPAVKIARLAVDRRHAGRGIGKALVDLALGMVSDYVSPRIGCRFVVVDAKRNAIDFYGSKCGFTLLDTEDNKNRLAPIMFLDLLKTMPSERYAHESAAKE